MDLLGNRGVDSDDLERLSDQVNQTAEDFGKFDTESYGEADGMTLTDDGFTDDITMDDQTDSICSMMVDAMQNIMEDPAAMDMDDFEMNMKILIMVWMHRIRILENSYLTSWRPLDLHRMIRTFQL